MFDVIRCPLFGFFKLPLGSFDHPDHPGRLMWFGNPKGRVPMDASTLSPGLRLMYRSSMTHWFLRSAGSFTGTAAFDFVVSSGCGGGHNHANRIVSRPSMVFSRSGSI